MKNCIEIKLNPIEENSVLDMDEFWKKLLSAVKKNISGTGSKQTMSGYYESSRDDLSFDDNTISLLFPVYAGCEHSAQISLHWTALTLSLNQLGFSNFFKSQGWEMATSFETIEEIRRKEKYFYFEYNTKMYGIANGSEGKPYLIYNQKDDLVFDDLSADLQKKFRHFLDQRQCQCSMCEKIRNKKIRLISSKNKPIPLKIKKAKNFKMALRYYNSVEELDMYRTQEMITPEINKLQKLKKLRIDINSFEPFEYLPDEICELSSLEELDVSGNPLKELPKNIGNLRNLRIFCCNQGVNSTINSLPDSFFKLEKLEKIDFSSKWLTEIPEQFIALKNLKDISFQNSTKIGASAQKFKFDAFIHLEDINLRYTGMTIFPESLSSMNNVFSIDFSGNAIKEIPSSFYRPRSLEYLNLADNEIEVVSEDINLFKNLSGLNLSGNKIVVIPESIYTLTNLKELSLGGNPIKYIDSKIGNLRNLKILRFGETNITELPESIGDLENLESLFIDGHLKSLPKSLLKCTKLKYIFVTFNTGKEIIKKYCNEIGLKIEVLG